MFVACLYFQLQGNDDSIITADSITKQCGPCVPMQEVQLTIVGRLTDCGKVNIVESLLRFFDLCGKRL